MSDSPGEVWLRIALARLQKRLSFTGLDQVSVG